jgi:hypothetical protein
MIRKIIRKIFIVGIFIPFLLHSEIRALKSIKEIKEKWDEKCWVLVDLDNCLFEAQQALGHADWFYDLVKDRMNKGMTKDEAIMDAYPLWIKTQSICEVRPIEPDFISLIKDLQNKEIVVIGLTHRQPSIINSTIRQVFSLSIDFTKTAPKINEPFEVNINGPSLFKKGVLFVGDYNKKSDVLLKFFEKTSVMPSKIVFFDDKRSNVEDLSPMLDKLGIDYLGVHYTGIRNKPSVYRKEIADLQYNLLDKIISN